MRTVTSKDGTRIALETTGRGRALILVGGATEQRAMNSEIARLAALPLMVQNFTVLHYDRRGRGDSTDTQPFAVEREAVAPTLAYDAAALGEDASVPVERAARLAVPALIMDGVAGYPFMHITAMAFANAIPNAEHRTLEGQTHEVAAEVIAPVLVEFFTAGSTSQLAA